MKTGFGRSKKMRMKTPPSAPVSNAYFKHRKIPKKPKGSRRDEEQVCGKERRSHAVNSDTVEREQ